jgi:hypothetical protein
MGLKGGLAVVNLFRHTAAQQGALTAALLALLEHSDKDLLNGLLRTAGISYQVEAGEDLTVQFPLPGGPPGAGMVATPHFRLAVAAQAPSETVDPAALAQTADAPLAITLAGQAQPGARALSWEQVDRWLATAAGQYDPDSRTGFLIGQFRSLLPEMGIEYFPGFDPDLLEQAPGALATLARYLETAGQFFDRFGPALAAVREGVTQVRQAQPGDLLAGYCYRDYTDPAVGASGFLRAALHVPERQLQLAVWIVPGGGTLLGGDPHSRLQEQLRSDPAFVRALQELGHAPLLWLWSQNGERKLLLDETPPEELAELDLAGQHAAIQVSTPFADLPGEDAVGRSIAQLQALLEVLSPVLGNLVH